MKLPIGYFKFHKDAFINYQLNRWYSEGFTRKEDIESAGKQIKNFETYVTVFEALAAEAYAQNRLKNAAFYYRAAEFLTPPNTDRKSELYNSFEATFYEAFQEEGIERHEVKYQNGYLPVLRLQPKNERKGTIVGFGGFDSFIEEFFCIWKYFSEAGYEVIAFEGPGQGAALRKHNLTFERDWEKPTSAILDHFDLSDVTLVGISMGGHWCIRTAAFEKRIERVIAFPALPGWLEMTGGFTQGLVTTLMRWRGLMNALTKLKMMNGKLRHTINQTLLLTGKKQPIEAVDWFLAMNKDHIHSELVDQDVLLLAGENDAFQPPIMLRKQKELLTNARSVTTRIFTKDEHADQHCQMGNLGLALEVMVRWVEEVKRPT